MAVRGMTGAGDHDLVVVGGGLGGIAAALAAARLGRRSVLVCETDWLGGQVSSQCIPPDEHPWIETIGQTRGYREFRARVRAFYRDNYPVTARARSQQRFNPGLGNIGPLTHEPHVAALVLESMLAPWISRGLITVLREAEITCAAGDGDEVRALQVRTAAGDVELTGRYFLDATDLGDVIGLAGVEHVIGAESRDETGELHALAGPADPLDQQAITWAMLLSHRPGTDNTIPRPAGYARWREFRPPEWPGPLLSWEVSDHVTHRPRLRPLFTDRPTAGITYDLWHARRILAADQFDGDWVDVTVAAWPMMDYSRLPLLGVPDETREQALREAQELSLSFLYWMQTEAPRHDGGVGYPGLYPRSDLTGTPTGLAKLPYIREGRRIRAEFTLLEQHIGVAARPGADGAERFADSVGIAAYRIDVHPSTAGRPGIDIDTWPFQLPLGSFLPVRVRNVLPAGKSIGGTHITSGAYRVHPAEWSIGEAAGALAAFSIARGVVPHQVRADAELLDEFQSLLTGTLGIELEWPRYGALTARDRIGYAPMDDEVEAEVGA